MVRRTCVASRPAAYSRACASKNTTLRAKNDIFFWNAHLVHMGRASHTRDTCTCTVLGYRLQLSPWSTCSHRRGLRRRSLRLVVAAVMDDMRRSRSSVSRCASSSAERGSYWSRRGFASGRGRRSRCAQGQRRLHLVTGRSVTARDPSASRMRASWPRSMLTGPGRRVSRASCSDSKLALAYLLECSYLPPSK
jgi:hypothetical protein